MSKFIRLLAACTPLLIWSGCSKDDAAPGGAQPGSQDSGSHRNDSGSHPTDGGGEGGGFKGDCKSKRWANVSDACWSCFCDKCETQTNTCGEDCFKVMQCANDKHALVGVGTELPCELRAFPALCLTDPASTAAAGPLLGFDTCLITKHDPAKEHLRACEAECGITYTGDVCKRFPAPEAGTP